MKPATERADFDLIASWVQPGETVLDLGCGDGSLLKRLIDERGAAGYGVELESTAVLAAIANDINVIQGDLEQGLAGFDDGTSVSYTHLDVYKRQAPRYSAAHNRPATSSQAAGSKLHRRPPE